MNTGFAPHGVYEDIINLLGQWKILDIKALDEMLSYEYTYKNLLKKVQRLEDVGFVKSALLGRKNKHIYLTGKGIELTSFDLSSEITLDNLTHDLIVSRVLRSLLDYKNFIDGKMFHQIRGDDIYPDAEILGMIGSEDYRMAIEVELTQKSQNRVKEKFVKYGRGKFFDFVLFITNKESLFKAYKNFLGEMNRDIQAKIIIIYDRDMKITKVNFKKANCFYFGEDVNFIDIFHIIDGDIVATQGEQNTPPP